MTGYCPDCGNTACICDLVAQDELIYEYRWVNKEFTHQEMFQLLIDRVAMLESRVRELEGDAA